MLRIRSAWRPLAALGLVAFALSCSQAAPAPAPAPARAPVAQAPAPAAGKDTLVLMGEPTVVDTLPTVEAGRFDTGKMWTFEHPPLDYFQQEYHWRPTPQWLDHVRLSALRLPDCSASFISPDGLLLSNHHCARDPETAVQRPGEDLLKTGFYAATQADERKVPDLYVDQLVQIKDVTAEIQSAMQPGQSDQQQVEARDQKIDEVGQQLSQQTGLKCDVTTLYDGGEYSAYCYRRYTDVRLVFVVETQIGYFGGDYDNFTYPRYDLDMSMFRVYGPDGKPLHTPDYLSFSDSGATPGLPVFVIGNPGSTSRLNTLSQLEYRRDFQYPYTIRLLQSRADILDQYMKAHPDQHDKYINDYFGYTNSLKAYTGELKGLNTPELMARKVAFEKKFRAAVEADTALARKYGSLWDDIAGLWKKIGDIAPRLYALNQGGSLSSQTLGTALGLVQYGQAAVSGMVPDSSLRQFRQELDTTHINPALDAMILAAQLRDAEHLVGADDPFVEAALQGRSPDSAAAAIVMGSAVPDSAKRAALLADPARIAASNDPAIQLTRELLPRLRQVYQQYRQVHDAEEVRTAQLGHALFDVYGNSIPPDATFTLRLADGVVQGYEYNGTLAPPITTFYGLYNRHFSHVGQSDWALPPRWATPPANFSLATPLDFVSTNDIIGGNSGSPVVNEQGRIVGLIFDGNIESLPGDFIYTTETNRAVAVHSQAILTALRDVYGAKRIVSEIEAARRQ
jgi:Peptidase S46